MWGAHNTSYLSLCAIRGCIGSNCLQHPKWKTMEVKSQLRCLCKHCVTKGWGGVELKAKAVGCLLLKFFAKYAVSSPTFEIRKKIDKIDQWSKQTRIWNGIAGNRLPIQKIVRQIGIWTTGKIMDRGNECCEHSTLKGTFRWKKMQLTIKRTNNGKRHKGHNTEKHTISHRQTAYSYTLKFIYSIRR